MKIIHVITRLLRAGSEENTVSSCIHQALRGHDVTIIHGPQSDPTWNRELSGTVTLIEAKHLVHKLNPLNDVFAIFELWNLYHQIRPDVVHTHQSKAGIVGRISAWAAGVPAVVHTVHIAPFLNVGGVKRTFYVAAERLCALFTHRIINVSQGMMASCLDNGVGKPEQHDVIHSGMSLERFVNAKVPGDWRQRIGGWPHPQRPKIVLMLAAFEPRKRQLELIRSISTTLSHRDDACFIFAGQGKTLEEARQLGETLGIGSKLRFLGHDPNPGELIALADLCLLTSEREGLPRVVVQYLAGGRPVVVSRLPGIEEIVVDDVNGRITCADDLDDTSRTIFELLDEPEELARLGHGARTTQVSSWGIELMGERIEAAYCSILANRLPAKAGLPT